MNIRTHLPGLLLGLAATVALLMTLFIKTDTTNNIVVESGFGKAILALSPQTKLSGFHNQLSTNLVSCKLEDCRENTIIIDSNSRIARIKTTGTGAHTTSINDHGEYVVYDNRNTYYSSKNTIKTQHSSYNAPHSIYTAILNNGNFFTNGNMGSKEDNPGPGFYYSVGSLINDRYREIATHTEGIPLRCVDQIYLIKNAEDTVETENLSISRFNWEIGNYEPLNATINSSFSHILSAACHQQGILFLHYEDGKIVQSIFDPNNAIVTTTNHVFEDPDQLTIMPYTDHSMYSDKGVLSYNQDGKSLLFNESTNRIETHIDLDPYFDNPDMTAINASAIFKDGLLIAVGRSKKDPSKYIAVVIDAKSKLEVAHVLLDIPSKEYGTGTEIYDFSVGDTSAFLKWAKQQPPAPQ